MSATRRFPLASARRSRSRVPRCWRCASPTWANSAGSCTCRWNSPRPSTARSCRPAPSSASPTPAIARSRSLRLEKGYRAWGADIGPDHTPFEAGLGWAVKLKTGEPFLGRDGAWQAQASTPLKKSLCAFTVDDPDGRAARSRDASIATASASAGSAAAATATRSRRTSATVTCAAPRASRANTCSPAATNSRWPPSACPARFIWRRCTIPTMERIKC